jgi:hypothetical protein
MYIPNGGVNNREKREIGVRIFMCTYLLPYDEAHEGGYGSTNR